MSHIEKVFQVHLYQLYQEGRKGIRRKNNMLDEDRVYTRGILDSYGTLSFSKEYGIPQLYIESRVMVDKWMEWNLIPSRMRLDGVEYVGDSVFQLLDKVYSYSYITLPESLLYIEWKKWKGMEKIEEKYMEEKEMKENK